MMFSVYGVEHEPAFESGKAEKRHGDCVCFGLFELLLNCYYLHLHFYISVLSVILRIYYQMFE